MVETRGYMEQIEELRQKIKQLQQQNEALKASIAEGVKKQVKAEFAAIEQQVRASVR